MGAGPAGLEVTELVALLSIIRAVTPSRTHRPPSAILQNAYAEFIYSPWPDHLRSACYAPVYVAKGETEN